MNEEMIHGFVEEVKELLLHLEDDLIALEKDPGDTELVNRIFRVMHTLKGSAGMVGFKNIQDLTHEFEGLYESVRSGDLEINSRLINATLKAKDWIESVLNNSEDPLAYRSLVDEIRSFAQHSPSHSQINDFPFNGSPAHRSFIIFFSPDKEVFGRGLDPEKALKEISATGNAETLLHEGNKAWEEQKAEKICTATWEIYLHSSKTLNEIEEIFLFYEKDEFDVLEIDQKSEKINPQVAAKLRKLYKNKIDPVRHVRESLKRVNAEKQVTKKNTEVSSSAPPKIDKTETEATVSVSSHKLDELMNLVSELVTLTATLETYSSKLEDTKLKNAVENVEKLTKKFRNTALDLRLVPVGSLLSKFKRQVRDLSIELDKKVNLLIEGQDIEIDKTILKSIESPMQHIIRNSIDHGLEKTDERIAKGKSPEGLLKITAFYSGASVIIQVQDDGRGINLEKVRECAIKKGFIQADQAVTKEELISFIMEPGFTTSENVSMVSGRGVGMDVVRKELLGVGGSLEVFTEKDLGTSITMKLPTTLTIIDTLKIMVADAQILIPIIDIEYCFKEEARNLFSKDNSYIQYKNNPLPLICLRKQFGFPAAEKEELMVIVINKFDRKYAIVADQIVGEHQAVIKPLGDLFVHQPYFSGGSIMVDGKLAFILDTNFIFNYVSKS